MHSSLCILLTYLSSVTVCALLGSSEIEAMDPNCDGSPLEFDDFINLHGRTYISGTEEYEMRRSIYNRRTAGIAEHNCRQNRMWTAGVNKLTDRTEQELKVLRGYRSMPRTDRSYARVHATLLQRDDSKDLPEEVSWDHLNAMNEIQDQGACGSCWAFAAATVLRAHSEIYRNDNRKFSVQQILSCTPNPRQCGGTGGCNGATAELAMEYVYKNGCSTEDDFAYTQSDQVCPQSMQAKEDEDFNKVSQGSFIEVKGDSSGGTAFGMTGWSKLPENQVGPLMQALVSGPVSVSVSAGYSWNSYWGGILNDCPTDAVIDHAVVLIGYGKEGGSGYWKLQNSWGQDWGENGHIRILRNMDEESNYCGWDNSPEVGSGCIGGPKKVYVCGMCGILYDAVVPHIAQKSDKVAASSNIVLMSRNASISKSLRVVKRAA